MKKLLIIISIGLVVIGCKKKDTETPNNPNVTTTGQNPTPQNYVNGYVLLYKNYNFSVSGNDTLYNKSYFANANLYNIAVDIQTDIGYDVYTGTLYANADSLYYSPGSGYNTYPFSPAPPISWGFTNSSIFGTNTVTINDTCTNLSKSNVFAIPKNISLSQNFVFDLSTINTPFDKCSISFNNLNTGQAGLKVASYGSPSIIFPATDLTLSAPDSVTVNILLTQDTYKTVNGKSILFRNIGNFSKMIYIVP